MVRLDNHKLGQVLLIIILRLNKASRTFSSFGDSEIHVQKLLGHPVVLTTVIARKAPPLIYTGYKHCIQAIYCFQALSVVEMQLILKSHHVRYSSIKRRTKLWLNWNITKMMRWISKEKWWWCWWWHQLLLLPFLLSSILHYLPNCVCLQFALQASTFNAI